MKKATNYMIVIGILVFLVGVYAFFFKAGLPYPDPTPEMARKWMFYFKLGGIAMPVGMLTVVTGLVVKLFLWLKNKFSNNDKTVA